MVLRLNFLHDLGTILFEVQNDSGMGIVQQNTRIKKNSEKILL